MTKLFVVDTVITYRMRYVVEANELSHALDEVAMIDSGNEKDSFDEVSQKFLSEIIVDGRPISKKEFNQMLTDLENNKDELSSWWMGDKLIRKVNYD